MPRNQTRASRRTRQGKQTAAAVRDDSAEESSETVAVTTESPAVGRNKRSTRNLSVIYSDSSRRVSGVTAERVTRSRTRASRNEATEPTRAPVDSDDDDSYSESDSSPRKKVRASRRRSSPRKTAKSSTANRTSKAGRKRKVGRRSRKQETEDEESEDSLHLSESEGEEMEQDNEEEDEEADNESERVKLDKVTTPRRGNRSGTRSSSASTPSTPNVSNKSSPSVVLLRMENTPTNAARPTRGRGAARQKKDPAAAAKSDDITASEEGESAAHTGSSRVRGRRSVRQSRQQQSSTQQQQQQQSITRRGKMVPTEENAAVTTDTANKEDGGDKEKEKPEEEKEQQPQEEKETTTTTTAVPEEEKSAAAAAAKNEGDGNDDEEKKEDRTDKPKDIPEKKDADNEGSTSAAGDTAAGADPTPVEKMEVDEPSGSDVATGDQVSKTTDAVEEVKTDSGNAGKHKLELEGDSGLESALLSKKAKLTEEPVKPEEKDAPKMDVEETKNATAELEKASNEDKTAASVKITEEVVTSEKIAVCDDSAINGEKAAKDPEPPSDTTSTTTTALTPAVVEPKVNGNTTDGTGVNNSDTDNNSASLGVSFSRRWVANPDLSDNAGKDSFSVVSYNLAEEDWSAKHQKLVDEVLQLSPSILCLQEIDEGYFKRLLDSALKSHGYIGLYKAGKLANKGLATFYLLSSFEVLHHRELEIQDLLEKDIHRANLLDEEKEALKSFLNSQAPVLITKLKSISTGKTITVGTVSLPSDSEVVLAVQVAAVMREILEISEGPNNPHVLCSSFDLDEDSVVYQLLRDGLLKNEVVDDLKKKAKVPVLEKESAEISTLLETFFKHSSANLKSSYGSILGHELTFPDKTQKLSKDSVWFSSNSLFTKNVLDVGRVGKQVPANNHVSLKVELGFMN